MNSTVKTKILAKIGYTFLDIQLTEKAVKWAIQIAMPDDKKLFSSLEEKLSAKDLARPLGVFLTELHKRAFLNESVDLLLSRYLVNRNIFIHDIVAPEGWSLKSKEGIKVINMQLESLLALRI